MRTIACVTFGLILLGGNLSNSWILRAQQSSAVQTHIGHIMDGFEATPNKQGLLPTALAEAKIATQHAGLAMKAPDNLDATKLHAGHVIHALDPGVEAKGPGLGFGVKRAAAGVAQHVQLAAKSQGAGFTVMAHSLHVAGAANSVVKRADEIISLAQKARAASTAGEASQLMGQVNAAIAQLTAGFDANTNGEIGFDAPEGGLAQAQQHMELLRREAGR